MAGLVLMLALGGLGLWGTCGREDAAEATMVRVCACVAGDMESAPQAEGSLRARVRELGPEQAAA